MKIKLNAKLTAYTHVESAEGSCSHDRVTTEQIDSLFIEEDTITTTSNVERSNVVSRAAIDSLFER